MTALRICEVVGVVWAAIGLIIAIRDVSALAKQETKLAVAATFIALIVLGPITLAPSGNKGSHS